MNPKVFLKMMKSLGLEYTGETGGHTGDLLNQYQLRKSKNGKFKLSIGPKKFDIHFVDPILFFNTIRNAEKTLELKLFS